MTTLYAGPWIGEFGWELCWWNPLVRYAATRHDRTVIAARETSRYLYEFADEFIPVQADATEFCGGKLLSQLPDVECDEVLSPGKAFANRKLDKLAWRKLGSPETRVADVICAFRPPKVMGGRVHPGKDYPEAMCDELVADLMSGGLTVACCGWKENYCPPGAIDMRGTTLGEQCDAIASALCAVGPSSGTIHLASLCGCPHVTWYTPKTHPHLNTRYKVQWNPFDTPVTFVDGHPPSPSAIAAAVRITVGQLGLG